MRIRWGPTIANSGVLQVGEGELETHLPAAARW